MSWNVIGYVIFLYFVYDIAYNKVVVAYDGVESESDVNESFEQPKIWSSLLEELALNPSTVRDGRGFQTGYKYIPTSNVYINRRVDNIQPLGAAALKQNINFNGAASGGVHSGNNIFGNRISQTGQNDVTETDLYLLSAIEKLVYRVDYMERRLRKTEQVIYYLMSGNNQHQKEEYVKPCAKNFTRIGDNCYYIVVNQPANWKTANNICKSYGAHLAELETLNENNDVVAYLLNHNKVLNGFGNFWLGGLNPGLLWIWSSTARPVNPNVNITQIQNSTFATPTPKINNKVMKVSKKTTTTTTTTPAPTNSTKNSSIPTIGKKIPIDKKAIVSTNSEITIEGNGRCLGFTYKADKHIYTLYGLDCTSRQKFICELPPDDIDNEIDRIAKKLFD